MALQSLCKGGGKAPPLHPIGGFTLIETLVATVIVATAAVALAHLLTLGATQSVANRRALLAIAVAQSKLEGLRAETWTSTLESAALAVSPLETLNRDTPGWVDHPAGLTRRWSVSLLDPGDPATRLVNVCVFTSAPAAEACVSTIRTRRP